MFRTLLVFIPFFTVFEPLFAKDECNYALMGDAELVEISRQGGSVAFGELASRYWDPVVRFLSKRNARDPEDIAQEALLQAYSKLPTLKNTHQFGTWLYQIAINEHKSKLRKMQPQNASFREDEGGVFEPAARPERENIPATKDLSNSSLAGELPPGTAEIYALRTTTHMTWEEIAYALNIPAKDARRQFGVAEKQLAQLNKRGQLLREKAEQLKRPAHKIIELVEIQRMDIASAALEMELSLKETTLLLAEARTSLFPYLFGHQWDKRDVDFVPIQFRETAKLVIGDQLSYADASKELDLPLGTVRSQVHRAHNAIDWAHANLSRYISLLPEHDVRQIAGLYFIDRYSPKEIAELINRPYREVENAIGMVRKRFKARYALEEGPHAIPISLTQEKPRPAQLKEDLNFTRSELEKMILHERSALNQRIARKILFAGMDSKEVAASEPALTPAMVTARFHDMKTRWKTLLPENLKPEILRRDRGALAEAIGWGSKVTNSQEVEPLIRDMMKLLDRDEAQAIQLHYLSGLTPEKAAAEMHLSKRAWHRVLLSARNKMSAYQPGDLQKREQDDASWKFEIENFVVPELRPIARMMFLERLPQGEVAAALSISIPRVKTIRRKLDEAKRMRNGWKAPVRNRSKQASVTK